MCLIWFVIVVCRICLCYLVTGGSAWVGISEGSKRAGVSSVCLVFV